MSRQLARVGDLVAIHYSGRRYLGTVLDVSRVRHDKCGFPRQSMLVRFTTGTGRKIRRYPLTAAACGTCGDIADTTPHGAATCPACGRTWVLA